MENIDFKTIILILIIIAIISGSIFLMTNFIKSNNLLGEAEQNDFQVMMDNTSDTQKRIVQQKTTTKTNQNVLPSEPANNPLPSGFEVNNLPPISIEDFKRVQKKHEGLYPITLHYYTPHSWDVSGYTYPDVNISLNYKTGIIELSEYISTNEDITYELLLERFIEKERNNSSTPNSLAFSFRNLELEDRTLSLVEKTVTYKTIEPGAVTNYLVLVKNGYVCYIEISGITEESRSDADKVFSSFYVTLQ